ncbi:MAG: hypothetical protein ACJ8AO_14345 [Gemmatimonadaceae bacterium]
MSGAGGGRSDWDAPVPVEARALIRGGEMDATASLQLLDDRLLVVAAPGAGAPRVARWQGALEVPYERLDGARVRAGRLTLYLRDGDLVELAPAGGEEGATHFARLGRAADEIATRTCRLPELTLSLRSLGSRGAGAEHDAFFGPLLSARERVAHALAESVRWAAERRAGGTAADRRALEAELAECAAPLDEALGRLGRLAAAVRDAPDDARFVHWREWAAGLRLVFARADGCWEASWAALSRESRASARPSLLTRLRRAFGREG